MKVSLIVASGVHAGKAIPINVPKFLIGRDTACQLRPASQAISKQHCGFIIRDGKVFAVDYGSTNGTSVNDQALAANTEREIKHGDRIKAGPLDFTISVVLAKPSDSTPLPADLKAIASQAGAKLKEAATGEKPKAKKAESDDDIAAMLLGMNDDDGPISESKIAAGSTTIMEMPAGLLENPAEAKKDDSKSKIPTKEGSSNAASDLLRKYMKRPR